ncbi:MAG: urea carboxylase-associated family protein [Planctomycetota bacterium]|nr:MAG: urea carboxylase-associated family protein [Planctomycetota bacterium]
MSTEEDSQGRLLFSESIPGGAGWSWVLQRGQRLRITDVDGGANVPLMAFNAAQPLERYNMPDTLKGQHTAYLTTGNVAYSDMGRCLLSFVDDSVGWHDTITGYSDSAAVAAKYGNRSYQQARNKFYRSAKELLLIELGKHGLGKRDVTASINCLSKVAANERGQLSYVEGHSIPGSHLTLRADMTVLVVLCAIQHPLDPDPEYRPRRIALDVYAGSAAASDDICRTHCEQNARAFTLTDRLFAPEGVLV